MQPLARHRIGLHESDSAGVLFTGAAITLAHATYERFLAEAGCDISEIIRAGSWALPIRRCEADFRQPMRHGQDIHLGIILTELRQRSFHVQITFTDAASDSLCAVVDITPVAIDQHSGRPIALPSAALDALKRLPSKHDCNP